ncbi:MAG: hypothetical protein M3O03_13500 [Pseudomonadota bacterium]|nr:hypothetical protein [Pseudomonadota bacterium]
MGITLPDPVPHPDDIVIDARKMDVRIAGPLTSDEFPRYALGADLLSAYEEVRSDKNKELETLPDGPDRAKLRKWVSELDTLCDGLRLGYGPREERTKDPLIRQVEEIVGVPFTVDNDEIADSLD